MGTDGNGGSVNKATETNGGTVKRGTVLLTTI